VTAREGALKVREASRVLAEGYDAEYLLHGSAVPLGGDDHIALLSPPDDLDGLLAAVGQAAKAEGITVTEIAETAPLHPLLAQIPLTVRLQLLALRFAERRGHDADVAITGAWTEDRLWHLGAPGSDREAP
jgi:glucosamine--fructose-6-phosphate aminotransferase (isomerizing)